MAKIRRWRLTKNGETLSRCFKNLQERCQFLDETAFYLRNSPELKKSLRRILFCYYTEVTFPEFRVLLQFPRNKLLPSRLPNAVLSTVYWKSAMETAFSAQNFHSTTAPRDSKLLLKKDETILQPKPELPQALAVRNLSKKGALIPKIFSTLRIAKSIYLHLN